MTIVPPAGAEGEARHGAALNRRRVPAKSRSVTQEWMPVLWCFADIEPTAVQWLWHHRIPLGRLTLVVGRPGEGKSFFTMELAAHVSTAKDFPDGSSCPSGSVLIVSAEDDPADTIRPRLDAAGADVNRIHACSAIQYTAADGKQVERTFTLADVPILEAAIRTRATINYRIIPHLHGGGSRSSTPRDTRSSE